jgi:hypothetical protein
MASNPSQNNAFELIATGEKTGTWGTITNQNLEIIDRATKGVGTITLSGTSYSLNTIDYTPSEGHYIVLVFAGSPSGTCTVTINPNDQQKLFIVRNTTAQSVVLTQGSGGNVTIASGKGAIVYSTGTGSNAAVVDVTAVFNLLRPSDIGTSVQAYDAGLQSISGLTTTADRMIYTTGSDAYAVTTLTPFARTVLDDTDAVTVRSTLGLVIGTDIQAYDAGLQSISGLTTSADRMIYTTGSDTYAVTTLTSFARTLLDDADAATARATLATASGTETLTNKTINLSSNTLTGTVSQFNTALSDGDFATLAGTETLTNKSLTSPTLTGAPFVNGSYRGNIVAVAALDIDCAAGNYFTKTINANSTFTFSNVPATRAYGFTLELTVTSGTVTWPTSVKFPGSVSPILTAGKTHLVMFVTDDGGTRWRGAALTDYET